MSDIRRVCREFGQFIETMSVWLYRTAPDFDRLMVYLNRHCHQLLHLQIIDYSSIDPKKIEKYCRVFARLERLEIEGVPWQIFLKHCTSLRELKYTLRSSFLYYRCDNNGNVLAKLYPNLEAIEINNTQQINCHMLCGVIKNSPHLKTLKLIDCELVDGGEAPETMDKIAELDNCVIDVSFNHRTSGFVHLLKSIAMKRLELNMNAPDFATISEFLKQIKVVNETVECLHMAVGCGNWTGEVVAVLSNIKTLKTLKIPAYGVRNMDASMSLIKNHPSLEELHVTISNADIFEDLLEFVSQAAVINTTFVIEYIRNIITKTQFMRLVDLHRKKRFKRQLKVLFRYSKEGNKCVMLNLDDVNEASDVLSSGIFL